MADKKIIGISIGDPAGIGPEIILRSLSELTGKFLPILIGKIDIFRMYNKLLDTDFSFYSVTSKSIRTKEHSIPVLEVLPKVTSPTLFGISTQKGARIAMEAIRIGTDLALSHKIDALVTAPIYKKGLQKAGFKFNSHTEFLAHHTNSPYCVMMLTAKNLKVALVTVHIPFKEILNQLTENSIYRTILTTHKSLQQMGISKPRIAVCGLNPHAGEEGLLGTEEQTIIQPAIDKALNHNITITGIFPPDTIFWYAIQGKADAVVALYHDQGLIAVKTIGFDCGVNVTIGLPFIRTSPDHGTAFDIAGQNKANPKSMIEAIRFALQHTKSTDISNE